jgi:hypothetical protein
MSVHEKVDLLDSTEAGEMESSLVVLKAVGRA